MWYILSTCAYTHSNNRLHCVGCRSKGIAVRRPLLKSLIHHVWSHTLLVSSLCLSFFTIEKGNNSTYPIGLLWGLNNSIHMKDWKLYLSPGVHHVLAAVIVVIIMFTFSHIAWTPEDVGICRDPWISPTFRSQSRAHRGLGICCLSLTHRFRVSQSLDLCFPAVPPAQDISSRSQNIPNFKAWEHQFFSCYD